MKYILTFLLSLFVLTLSAQEDYFGGAKWIGAITREASHLPEGRLYQGAVLKDSKELWAQVDTLSRRSIVLRRDFQPLKAIEKAEIRIAGLGFYELSLNGKKVGDSEFTPLWSDYDKTIYYNTYDVTSYITADDNQIQVLLGNGFFNEQGERYHKLKISFGPPTLHFLLWITYTDQTHERLLSDENWEWAFSPITFNSIYGGEDYDARLEPKKSDALAWHPVVVQSAPKGRLTAQVAEPVKVMEYYDVKKKLRKDSIIVFDMGQNLAGFPEITVKGLRGQRLKITPAETLTPDGFCNQKQTGHPHYYTYTLKGDPNGETWHPRFSYYSFRYLQVEGDIKVLKNIQSCFVYNSARTISTFECSNPLINDTHRLIDRAIRSNWQAVWTDCPAREKLGWLEQDWLNGEALVYNYDARSMIRQTMQNIVDAQRPDGSMPEIAPEYTQFTGSWARPFQESPEWGGAIIALPMLYLLHYGSIDLANEYYEPMKRYFNYLTTQDSCFILRQGLGDWYDYGPGRAGFSQNTPIPLVATAHYYQWACYLFIMAKRLKYKEDAIYFNNIADSIRHAFNNEFYDPVKHSYGTGSQCSLALPLYLQLVSEDDKQAVLDRLISDIHAHGDRLTTGDVGNRYLFYALVQNGQRELLYKMLNHYDVPSYGYQIKKGMTTLTEQWNPEHGASMNHFMMGHIENLLIPDLLGINLSGDYIQITPHPVGDIKWCKGSTESPFGEVKVSWKVNGKTFAIDIDIPKEGFADFTFPYSQREEAIGEGHHHFEESIVR